MNQSHIRNFAIIAHIDHGKSTLADRLLELTHTVQMRDMEAQVLDSNPIERERGITIKLAPVRMKYRQEDRKTGRQEDRKTGRQEDRKTERQEDRKTGRREDGTESRDLSSESEASLISRDYILNLIDTPGHVDFSYEVSRSLAACEGAILVVDATQGIQAQTLANLHQARMHKLVIIPVLNKIDLPNARIPESIEELKGLGFKEEDVIQISAKTGENVPAVLDAIVERVPAPSGANDKPLRALIFSSQYDTHKGVVVFVRVVDGEIEYSSTTNLQFMFSGATVSPIEVGYFTPRMSSGHVLLCGEVGYIATGLKDIRFAKVGDTIIHSSAVSPAKAGVHGARNNPKLQQSTIMDSSMRWNDKITIQPLPGYKEPKSMVFLGLFPLAADEFQDAREAMEKLRLSDSAFTFRPISSLALGNGFHCGFLGLLHAEVVQERLLREFGLTMLATAPSVEYRLRIKDGVSPAKLGLHDNIVNDESQETNWYAIQSASEYPDPTVIEEVKEPVMQLAIFSPKKYVGAIMTLCQEKRGAYVDLAYVGEQAQFTYLMPLSEMIVDFFDRLKSATEGYASLDYEFFDYQTVEVVKLDILVNKEKVDAFATLVVKEQALGRGKDITERLADTIPKQQFEVPIQAAIGGQVIARADVKAFRKDVIAKLYGGDRSRKDKLLDKQKKGKAKMKMIGRVEIPQSAFFAVLKRE